MTLEDILLEMWWFYPTTCLFALLPISVNTCFGLCYTKSSRPYHNYDAKEKRVDLTPIHVFNKFWSAISLAMFWPIAVLFWWFIILFTGGVLEIVERSVLYLIPNIWYGPFGNV